MKHIKKISIVVMVIVLTGILLGFSPQSAKALTGFEMDSI